MSTMTKSFRRSARRFAACLVTAAAALVCAPGAWAGLNGGRYLLQGTTENIGPGVSMVGAGNDSGLCNYIGVDSGATVCNVNGGTLWCYKGSGYGDLGIGINGTKGSVLNITDGGVLKVDRYLRSGVHWGNNDASAILAGYGGEGTVNVIDGTAIVNTFYMGATSENNGVGSSTLNLSGGSLTVNALHFLAANTQTFTWGNGTLVAAQANIFTVETYAGGGTRTMQITGSPSVFKTEYIQTVPAGFTGVGTLKICGGGAVSFAASSVPYGVSIASDGVLDLGTLDANAVRLTTPALSVESGATITFTLPANPSGSYPLVAASSLPASVDGIAVECENGSGTLQIQNGVLCFVYGSSEPATVYPDYFVEWIKTDGSQYIDTGVIGKTGTKVEMDVNYISGVVLLGSTPNGTDIITFAQNWNGIGAMVGRNGGNTGYALNSGRHILQTEATVAGVLTMNVDRGSDKILTNYGNAFDSAQNLYLFCGNNGGTAFKDWYCTAELYSLKIWQIPSGGTEYVLVRNFKPCVKGGRAGLYDAVSRKIFYSTAGNNFTVGPKLPVLTHRYSFDGDLSDSVGNADAFTVNGSGVTVANGKATTSTTAGGLQLGDAAGILGNDYATIEVWGKSDAASPEAWSRIFEYCWQPASQYLFSMMWSSDPGNGYKDSITFNYPNSKGFGNSVGNLSGDSGSPYSTTDMNYLCATFKADGSGNTEITCRRYDSATGDFVTKSYTISGWTLADMRAAKLYLGQQNWNGGIGVFNSTYDEVRIYGGVVPEGLLALNAAMGADVTAFTYNGNGNIDFNIPAGYTLPVNAKTLGADYSTEGTVTLGAGAKIEFNPEDCGSGMKFTAEGGFVGSSGAITAATLSQFATLTDTVNFVLEMSEDGKTIEVKSSANVAADAYWTGGGAAGDMDDPANWKCVNSAGDVIANGLPAGSTAVWAREGDGATSFAIPDGYTPNWASFNVGGNVSLSAVCDWSALPVVKLANGATLDLNGNNLKATHLEADSGTASVVNTASGTKPLLWRENATHETALVGTGVAVDTANVEVKLVNSEDLTIEANLASSLDATFEQSAGDVTATANPFGVGTGGHAGSYTLNGGTLTSRNSLVTGWGGTGAFRQVAGTVTAQSYLTIGYQGGTGTYRLEGGTLLIGGGLSLGELSGGNGTFWQADGVVTNYGVCFVGNGGGIGGRYIMEGGSLLIDRQALRIGRLSPGEFSISNGTVDVKYQTWVGDGATGNGTLRVKTGGTLITPFISPNENGANTVEFDGGTVKATDLTATNPFLNNLTNVLFGAGGVMIDAAGHDLTIANCTFKAAPGVTAITFANGGTLTFTGTTLELAGKPSGHYVFAKATGNGTFSGVPSLDVKGYSIRLSSDRKRVVVVRKGLTIIIR